MAPKIKARADQLAFEQGLAESREKAKSLIMAGRVVYASGPLISRPVPKPGQLCAADTLFSLLPGERYASRGAYKLQTILDACKIDVSGLCCLDAGASTGGFTDLLLQRGAKKVYAVDVGKNQLHEKLRADPRVVSMEGVNLRDAPASLIPEKIDFLTGDLSFISLALVLPALSQWLAPGALCALLIKPQFELSPAEVVKGVVRNEESRKKAVDKIVGFCERELGWTHLETLPSAIKGPKGNQEYMALFKAP